MKWSVEIGPVKLGGEVELRGSKPAPASTQVQGKHPDQARIDREKEWEGWQANRAATGGQFGFGRTDLTAIERPANRWETQRGGRVKR